MADTIVIARCQTNVGVCSAGSCTIWGSKSGIVVNMCTSNLSPSLCRSLSQTELGLIRFHSLGQIAVSRRTRDESINNSDGAQNRGLEPKRNTLIHTTTTTTSIHCVPLHNGLKNASKEARGLVWSGLVMARSLPP